MQANPESETICTPHLGLGNLVIYTDLKLAPSPEPTITMYTLRVMHRLLQLSFPL